MSDITIEYLNRLRTPLRPHNIRYTVTTDVILWWTSRTVDRYIFIIGTYNIIYIRAATPAATDLPLYTRRQALCRYDRRRQRVVRDEGWVAEGVWHACVRARVTAYCRRRASRVS